MTHQGPAPGPLTGLRILDLSRILAGPTCTQLFGDLGADVIKVERPGAGDDTRHWGPPYVRDADGADTTESAYYLCANRNKRSVTIDFSKPAGAALVCDLLAHCDVLIENLRVGALAGYGLGYDDLRERFPGLVYCSISGFGQDGPYSDRGGYGVVCEAVSGLREITGDPDRPPPRVATSMADYIAGLYGAFGAMMAIYARTHTGRGQVVDSSLYEGSYSFMEPHVPVFQQLGIIAERAGPLLPGNAPNSIYPTRDGRYVLLAAASNAVFQRLTEAMGRPELMQDPRFASAVARAENQVACDAEVAAWTATLDLTEAEAALDAAKVPAARIYTVEDIFQDPHYKARDMLVDVQDPVLGPVTVTGVVPKLSESPGTIRWAGRDIGADTAAVLAGELGLDGASIEKLARDGIVYGENLPTEEENS